MSHRRPKTFVVASLLIAFAQVATAQTNGSFENDFTGWQQFGDCQIVTGSIGTNPTDGTHQALIATATDVIVQPGQGIDPVQLANGLGIDIGGLALLADNAMIYGSGIRQTVTLAAGDKLSIDWDFLTNETDLDLVPPSHDNNDFAFIGISPTSPTKIADTFSTMQITPVENPFIAETLYHTFEFTAQSAGDYTIGIGVMHMGNFDNGVNSGLLVDNVRIAAVPEPTSIFAMGAGIVGLLTRRRRRATK